MRHIGKKNLLFPFHQLPYQPYQVPLSELKPLNFGSTCQSTSIFWQLFFLPALCSLTCKTSHLQDKVQKWPTQLEPEWRNVLPNRTCSHLDGLRFSQRPFLLWWSPLSKRNLCTCREDQGKNQEDINRRSVASRWQGGQFAEVPWEAAGGDAFTSQQGHPLYSPSSLFSQLSSWCLAGTLCGGSPELSGLAAFLQGFCLPFPVKLWLPDSSPEPSGQVLSVCQTSPLSAQQLCRDLPLQP